MEAVTYVRKIKTQNMIRRDAGQKKIENNSVGRPKKKKKDIQDSYKVCGWQKVGGISDDEYE